MKIGRIEFTTRLNPGPVRPGSVSLTVKDEDGGIGPDAYSSWGGGEPRLHVDALLRGARLRIPSPGHKTVNELTHRGAMTDGRPALISPGREPWEASPPLPSPPLQSREAAARKTLR